MIDRLIRHSYPDEKPKHNNAVLIMKKYNGVYEVAWHDGESWWIPSVTYPFDGDVYWWELPEDGVDMLAIKNQMIKDEFCAMNSIPYFAKKILAASTRVTKIEQIQESDEAKINRLKALNRAEAKERQSPKVTAKFEKEIVE